MQEITLENIFNALLQFKEEANKRFTKIDNHLSKINSHLAHVDSRLDGHDAQFISLGNALTKMEYEHGEKLAFLCDYVKINNEQHKKFEEKLDEISSKIYDHDIRIEVLEENFQKAF